MTRPARIRWGAAAGVIGEVIDVRPDGLLVVALPDPWRREWIYGPAHVEELDETERGTGRMRYQAVSRKKNPRDYLPDFYVMDTAQTPPQQVAGPFLNLRPAVAEAAKLEQSARDIDVLSRAAMAPAPTEEEAA